MMTEQEDQPVLLTEGSFAQEDEKTQSETAENETESAQQKTSGGTPVADRDSADSTGVEESESVRPTTAPETEPTSVAESRQEIERSVNALKTTSGSLSGDGDDEEKKTKEKHVESQPQERSDIVGTILAETGSVRGDVETEYVAPPVDPYMRAINYMEKHKVMQIFQKLTAEIVYHRPPDPLEHMLSELQKMKRERDAKIDTIMSTSSQPPSGS